MRWMKLGVVFDPRGRSAWIHSHALQPTPLLLEDGRIRVYVGFRDQQGVSRVGYVEVSGHDPTRVIEFSNEPVLDIGLPGTFDDNGVVPSAVVSTGKDIRLYYAGSRSITRCASPCLVVSPQAATEARVSSGISECL